MADENTNHEAPSEVVVPLPEVVAQEAKTVGDENLEVREPDFSVHTDTVPAQVMGTPDAPSTTVAVHETSVTMDTVITDTSDPLAVQVPDAGRGTLDLPIHNLSGPTVESVFSDANNKASEEDKT